MSVLNAIKAVEKISSDLVALPGSDEYDSLAKSYFTELEREIKPACFITPSSTAEVADIVKAIKPFAMPSMLAICGGLSYFAYAQGLICDNVVNYEIVLASGEIVNANAEVNRDLWVALKGGGNNFGIVTRFDLRAFSQGQLWGGKVFYFQPSFSGQISSLVEYLKDPNPDVDVHICLSLGYAPVISDLLAMNDIFCTRPEKPKALEPFSDVEPQINEMKTLRVASLKALTDEGFSGAVANRVIKMTTTVKADTEILEYAVNTFRTALDKLKGAENLLFSITFEPIPVSLIEQSIARGGNPLGLKPSDGPLVVILLYTSWDKPSDDDQVYEVNKEALQEIEAKALDKNVYSPYLYMNYAFPHQDPINSYGSEKIVSCFIRRPLLIRGEFDEEEARASE
ncbi:hypothetical protein E0Z10_g2234 [Xylaria hypoxylon]|uniref:FAD-binding PCMH-type domain-containing protein n=1 Tax=Xylaria hypoxylon TaxID=37992 RepID=A0A4Z0ZAL2_9PEZI|nr:hypothetical protein E0Z10_g2234 [Xylaria hypoxylon]